MDDVGRFEQLIKACHSCISIITHEERYALEIVRNVAVNLKRDIWMWSAAEGVRDGLDLLGDVTAIFGTDKPADGLSNFAGSKPCSICITLDLAEYLRDAKTFRVLRELIDSFDKKASSLVMIDSSDKLPEVIKAYAVPFEISLPDQKELKNIIVATLKQFKRKEPLEVGISKAGLETIIRNLRGLTRRQAVRIILDAVVDDHVFSDEDINSIIANKRRMVQKGRLLEYIQTPLSLDEIGGMRKLKKWLKNRKDAFTSGAETFGITMPRGVLMLGVQGAGKSLCAKAVATAWKQPLLRLDPGSLYASYVGESEKNLRQALKQTQMMAPVVLWIDEIEKAFASAASQSTDGGLSKRMFGTLLTWMQEHEEPVFVIATANDIEALPPELLRKGRFDEIFFVNLPTRDTRKKIFEIHIKKRKRDAAKFDLDALAEASDGYSGAEIEQAVISALHEAYATKADLTTDRILSVLKASPPLSVTMAEKVQALLDWAEDRCVPAD
ncbi:MAG: AAA family ATPase [Planctomycetota bacterium]|jgi:AAA+ superfamily predicted ATPase